MKTMVVYDSVFGNTEKIAKAVAASFGEEADLDVVKAAEFNPEKLKGLELLVVGSPTRAFRPTKEISSFLQKIPANCLKGIKVAAFDTRIPAADIKSRFFNIIVKIFGYAAVPIASMLVQKGGNLIAPPEGFYVKGSEGPLKDGELDRASSWIKLGKIYNENVR